MNDHYYSEKPHTKSKPRTWDVELRGETYRFASDEGVFSKRGVDFGSRLLIDTFQLPDIAGRLLDVGCGYGPIGLTLAKKQLTREVVMVDVNERAVHLATQNAARNHIANVKVLQSDLFQQVIGSDFAAIVSNPPIRAGKQVVYKLFEEAYAHLLPSGEFWVVIRKQQGAPSALKKLTAIFPEVTTVKRKKGYVVIRSKKIIDAI